MQASTQAVVLLTKLHWRPRARHNAALVVSHVHIPHQTLLRWYKMRRPPLLLPTSCHGNCLPTDQQNLRWCMHLLCLWYIIRSYFHLQMRRGYLSVHLSVCSNIWKPWPRNFIFVLQIHIHNICISFMYRAHRVKVSITGAKECVCVYCLLVVCLWLKGNLFLLEKSERNWWDLRVAILKTLNFTHSLGSKWNFVFCMIHSVDS